MKKILFLLLAVSISFLGYESRAYEQCSIYIDKKHFDNIETAFYVASAGYAFAEDFKDAEYRTEISEIPLNGVTVLILTVKNKNEKIIFIKN